MTLDSEGSLSILKLKIEEDRTKDRDEGGDIYMYVKCLFLNYTHLTEALLVALLYKLLNYTST